VRPVLVLSAAVVVAAGTSSAAARGETTRADPTTASRARVIDAPRAAWAPGRVLVAWRRGVDPERARSWLEARGARRERRIRGLGVDVVRLGPGDGVAAASSRFEASPLVAAAQPDYVLGTFAEPLFGDQWGLHNTGQAHRITNGGRRGAPATARGEPDADIDAPEAWTTGGAGSPDTVIAILDSGVDIDHPDLAPNVWDNSGEIDDGKDNDGNGYVDDLHGWDFARNSPRLIESNQDIVGADHGTHVAGIAAAASNGVGVVGACPNCSLMVLKFMRPIDTNGDHVRDTMVGLQSWELAALAYARKMGADVVNASFGGLAWSHLERRAFVKLGRAGTLSVVAAGNGNGDNDMYLGLDFDNDNVADSVSPAYPASYDIASMLSVAAANHNDEYGYDTACALKRDHRGWPCTFTNWGHDSVDLTAPGVDIRSTVPSPTAAGRWKVFDGTSMAAPYAAGVAGLVKSERPGLGPRRLKSALMNSVDRSEGLRVLRAIPRHKSTRGGFTRSSGRLNAARALISGTRNRFARTDGNVSGARRLRKVARGRVAWPRDVNDVYRKRLRPGRTYSIRVTGPKRSDLDLIGYKPGTKEIWQIELGCFTGKGACKLQFYRARRGSDEVARFTAKTGGVYFFQVSSFFSAGRYRLVARRV
jgi:subtilisin family serine protease